MGQRGRHLTQKARVVVLASGEGTNFEALYKAGVDRKMRGGVLGLISDKRTSGVVARAQKFGVPISFADTEDVLLNRLSFFRPDLIALAGFNKILSSRVLDAYPDRIINTHSAPLPEYGGRGMYGRRLREAVLEDGLDETAITIHLASEVVDGGKILGVQPVPILDGDTVETLEPRILLAENDFYWRVVDDYLRQLGFA